MSLPSPWLFDLGAKHAKKMGCRNFALIAGKEPETPPFKRVADSEMVKSPRPVILNLSYILNDLEQGSPPILAPGTNAPMRI